MIIKPSGYIKNYKGTSRDDYFDFKMKGSGNFYSAYEFHLLSFDGDEGYDVLDIVTSSNDLGPMYLKNIEEITVLPMSAISIDLKYAPDLKVISSIGARAAFEFKNIGVIPESLRVESTLDQPTTFTFQSELLAGNNDSIDLHVFNYIIDPTNNAGNIIIQSNLADSSGFETINFYSEGAKNVIYNLSEGNSKTLTTINFFGTAPLVFQDTITANNLKKIDASQFTGGLTYTVSGTGFKEFIGGIGNDYLDPGEFSYDTIYDGGGGNDTFLFFSSSNPLVDSLIKNVKNFENILIHSFGGLSGLTYDIDITKISPDIKKVIFGSLQGAKLTLPDEATLQIVTPNLLNANFAAKSGNGKILNILVEEVDVAAQNDMFAGLAVNASDYEVVNLEVRIPNTQTVSTMQTNGTLTMSGTSTWVFSGAITADIINASNLQHGNYLEMQANSTPANNNFVSIIGSDGDDILRGSLGRDKIRAGLGDDTIYADMYDEVSGGGGNDTVRYASDVSIVITDRSIRNVENIIITKSSGGTYNFSGQTENLTITGTTFDDVISGGSGTNTVILDDGDDTYVGGDGMDSLTDSVAAAGFSTITGAAGTDELNLTLTGTGASLVLSTVESVTITTNGDYSLTISNTDNSMTSLIVTGGTNTLTLSSALGSGIKTVTATGITGGSDSLIMNSLSAGTGGMTITGSDGDDVLYASAGNDSVAGGKGADTLYLGAGIADEVVSVVGDSVIVIGGAGDSGTITGFDTVNSFALGNGTNNSNIMNVPGTASIVANTTGTNGVDSNLTIGGNAVMSHAISSGIITFDDNNTFASALTINSAESLAAVVEYLQAQDIGNIGSTVAFVYNGADTYVYTQGSDDGADNTLDILARLTGVVADSLITTNGSGNNDLFIA